MKHLIAALSLITVLVSFVAISPHQVFAQEYILKATIVVPPDWKDRMTTNKLEKYKNAVITGFSEAQGLYNKLLNGKTFNFSSNVAVEYSAVSIEEVKAAIASGDRGRISKVMGKPMFAYDDRVVDVLWGVGTNNSYAFGDPGSHLVWMRHQDLIGLSAGSDNDDHKWALGSILMHELGHVFGAVDSGYARYHPCTVDSQTECIDQTPQPYPSGREWQSIMGYGTTYRDYNDLFFNNTLYNPEINKLYKSPFLNPQGDPAPNPQASGNMPAFTTYPNYGEARPRKVFEGQTFTIFGTGLSKLDKVGIYKKDPEDPSVPIQILRDAEIVENTGISIKIKILENSVEPKTFDYWYVTLTDDAGNRLDMPDRIGIYSKDQPSNLVSVKVLLTCGEGEGEQPLVGQWVSLRQRKEDFLEVGSGYSAKVPIDLIYEIPQEGPDAQYLVSVADSIQVDGEKVEVKPIYYKYIAEYKDGQLQTSISSVSFNYPKCPLSAEVSPTPAAAARGLDAPLRLQISNYDDFRENPPGDEGSQTQILGDLEGAQELIWNLSTLTSEGGVYIREIYSDNSVKDQKLQLSNGQVINIGNVQIIAKKLKRIVKVQFGSQEKDRDNIAQGFDIELAENSGSSQIPVSITYSDGSTRNFAYTLNYQTNSPTSTPTPDLSETPSPTIVEEQPTPTPDELQLTPTPTPQEDQPTPTQTEEVPTPTTVAGQATKTLIRATINGHDYDPSSLSAGFPLDLPGTVGQNQTFSIPISLEYSDGSRRNFVYTFNYRSLSQPTPTTTQTQVCTPNSQGPTCDTNSCSDGTVCAQGHQYCLWDGSGYGSCSEEVNNCAAQCTGSTSSPTPTCEEDFSDSYSQCGGTAGLEEYDPERVYEIIRIKDCNGNFLRYGEPEDVGECPN